MSLVSLSCKDFVEKLSSAAPFPGGGGAAAYAGALGTALGTMAGNISCSKKQTDENRKILDELLTGLKRLQEEFLQLIDEDAKAFEPLSKAYKIPKDNENRETILLEATLTAVLPPIKMMRAGCRVIELLENLCEVCNRMLLSDVGCGSLLCVSAIEAAAMNVFINTKTLVDINKKKELNEEADRILNEYIPRGRKLSAYVLSQLRS